MVISARRKHRRGTALILYTVLLPTLLLFVGLGIDLTILYVVQTRLSAAVDGAALGSGRLLGTSANTTEIAGEFLKANFPAGYWGSYNLSPNISVTTNASLHTIVVNASVQVPLLFLRILSASNSTVAATATAVRRDVRVELVLDRSHSMINQMANMRSAAATFTSMFTPETDEMGLVVLSGSSFVAYPNPTLPVNTNWVGGNGPDVHFADPVSAGGQNMVTMINNMQLGSDTNTSEAMWLAYLELQKAAAIDNDPTKENVIVLFTDGLPNGFTTYLNNPSSNALSGGNNNCYYNPATAPGNQQLGWIASSGNTETIAFFDPTSSKGTGLYKPLIFDTSNSAYYWDKPALGSNPYVNDLVQIGGTPMTNCQHITDLDLSGLGTIPAVDYYGTSTSSAAYTQSTLYQTYNVAYDNTQPASGYHMGIASWGTADNVAQRILSDSSMNVAIYTIGFTGNGGVDAGLLKRMANTQDATSYNSSYQSGLYVESSCSVPADCGPSLQRAFQQVASEVLKLKK